MIKQTLMFTTPVSLSLKDQQMVSMLSVTDKQYGDIVNFWGKENKKKVPTEPLQLEFF